MAAPSKFIKAGALTVEYRRAKEGPNSFLVWEAPGRSYICMTGAGVIKETKWTKGTQTGAALREWLELVEEEKDGDVTLGAAP